MSDSRAWGVEDSPHASDSTSPDPGSGSTVAPGAFEDRTQALPPLQQNEAPRQEDCSSDPHAELDRGGSPWLPAAASVYGHPVLSDRTAPLPMFPAGVPASSKVDFALNYAQTLPPSTHEEAPTPKELSSPTHPVLGEETAQALNVKNPEVTSAFSLLNANGTQHVNITVPAKYALATVIGASTVAGAFLVLLLLTVFG